VAGRRLPDWATLGGTPLWQQTLILGPAACTLGVVCCLLCRFTGPRRHAGFVTSGGCHWSPPSDAGMISEMYSALPPLVTSAAGRDVSASGRSKLMIAASRRTNSCFCA
jgi:hypothetical protein